MKNLKTIFSYLIAAIVVMAMPYFAGAADHSILVFAATGMMVAPDPIRAAYSRAVEHFKAENGVSNPSDLGLQQFNCRLIKELSNTNNSYTLDVKSNNAVNTDLQNFEIKTPDKNHFFCAFIRVSLRKFDATNKLLYPVFTYSDGNYHVATNEFKSVFALFNGTTDVVTDNASRVVNLTNDVFYLVPGQQYELVASAQPFFPAYGPALEDKGYHQLAGNQVMDTNKVNQVKVLLKGYQAAIEGGTDKNVLQVDIYGWLFGGVVSGGGACGVTV